MKDMKFVAYPVIAVAVTLGLGAIALFWGRPHVDPQFNTALPTAPTEMTPQASPESRSPAVESVPAEQAARPGSTVTRGGLRVSNQTDHPVRLALLARPGQNKTASPASPRATYRPPVHWDFDPAEGSQRGLLLSLPQGPLQLKPGDILVAFAQDGSRQYWGPFVVGETQQPLWNAGISEWQLVLQN